MVVRGKFREKKWEIQIGKDPRPEEPYQKLSYKLGIKRGQSGYV